MAEYCDVCGGNLALIGRIHRCMPRAVERALVNNGIIERQPVNNAQRQAKWRKANQELNKQRAREGMRKLRQKNSHERTAEERRA